MRLLRPLLSLCGAIPAALFGSPAPGSDPATTESKTALEAQRRLFDTDSDTVNFEEGTMVYKGRTISLGDSRFMRARFDRYLNASVDGKSLAAYQAVLSRINSLLAANECRTREKFEEAFALLFEAATHDEDGAACLVVANQLHNSLRTRGEMADIRWVEVELDRRRRYEEGTVANRAKMGGPAGDSAFRMDDLAATVAEISSARLYQTTGAVRARVQFQAAIINLLVERRWEHAVIACGFYRHIFKASSAQLETGRDLIEKFFPNSGTVDTVEALEGLAREAMAEVAQGMDSVRNTCARGQLIASLERLQETFFLGERLVPVLSFDVETRLRLGEVFTRSREMRQLLDLKDYREVEKLAVELRAIAPDFPARRILSLCGSARRGSNLELFHARTALARNQDTEAGESLARAAALWPGNPAILEFAGNAAGLTDEFQTATRVFDELEKSGTKRQLFERSAELGAALRHDPERVGRLRKTVAEMQSLEFLLGQSRTASDQGNHCTAWDCLAEAATYDPSDVKLNRAIAELAPQVSGYVQTLRNAEKFERQGDHAAALSHYLAAQEINPVSKVCHEGVKRNCQHLLEKLAAQKALHVVTSRPPFPENR